MKCPKCNFEWNHHEKRIDRCTYQEAIDFCVSLGLPISDGEYLFNHWEAYGWRNRGMAIKSWKAVVRSWKAAGYMPSQREPAEPKPKPDWRRILRKIHPGYGWIPTFFHDLPPEIQREVKQAMN